MDRQRGIWFHPRFSWFGEDGFGRRRLGGAVVEGGTSGPSAGLPFWDLSGRAVPFWDAGDAGVGFAWEWAAGLLGYI